MAIDFSQSYATGTFNLTTGAVNIAYLTGKPNDSGAGIYINLINNVGAVVNPTVETMILYATRPDGTKVYFVGENELDRIRIDFNSSIYEVVGNVSAEIQLIDSNGLKKTSNTFTINASEQVFDASYVKSTDDFRVLKEALDTVAHLDDKFDEVIANVTVDSEVINARSGFPTLNGRLDNIESTKANATDVNTQLTEIEQDIVNHEERITNIETYIKTIEIESWADVQKIVRAGIADKVFTVGDQFVAKYEGVDIVWDVIGINHDEPSDPQYTHSLTIQTRDCLMNCVFDAAEPTNPNSDRQQYGSNNYLHSNIRQWLNSEDAVFNFTPQTAYDTVPSSEPYNGAGFLYNLDPELKAVIGSVKKQVAKNTITDGGWQDLFHDKVFLISRVEAYGGDEGDATGEKPYEYYSMLAPDATVAEVSGRIKYLNGSPSAWWLRSPYVTRAYSTRYVYSGSITANNSSNARGLSPACTIY